MKKIFYFSLILFASSQSDHLIAQQYQQSSLYMYNTLYYNPAYAGTRGTLSASLISRTQWAGFNGAPRTQYLSAHTPIDGRNLAVGGTINYDKIGARSKFTAHAVAAASIRLNKYGDRLSVGFNLGVDNYSNDFHALLASDPGDGLMVDGRSVMRPNVGLGVYYYGKQHYIGASVPAILAWKDINKYNVIKQHAFITAGYVYEINSVFFLKPSTLIKYVVGSPLTVDLTVSFIAYEKYWAGIMARSGEGIGVNLAYVLNRQFTIGYAYDFPFNKLRTVQSGTHEIMLQFDFITQAERVFAPRYF